MLTIVCKVDNHILSYVIIIIIIIIIITLNGAIQNIYNLLTVSNTYAQVGKTQLCANHVQHIKCNVTCVPRGTKGQLNYYV